MNKTLKESLLLIFCLCTIVLCSSCTFFDIDRQARDIEMFSTIRGVVNNDTKFSGQSYALLLKETLSALSVVDEFPVNSDGSYTFHSPPGKYFLAAFVDVSGDGKYQEGEPANYLQHENSFPRHLELGENNIIENVNINSSLRGGSRDKIEYKLPYEISQAGNVVSLDSDVFSSKNADLGLWQPLKFLEKTNAGLYMLQEFSPHKKPVIFIHGIKGSPQQFASIIASMDKKNLQPWVLYYPSGLRLDMISDYLMQALSQLQARYDFQSVSLVAHSMGGLVLRSFAQKNSIVGNALNIDVAVTISSPLLGMKSAATGVKTSPLVLPVWRDIASNSEFISSLHRHEWPKQIPYYLFFSYLEGKDGDGVVPLSSQLSLQLQKEASKVVGFKSEHSQALDDDDVIKYLNKVLSL